MILAMNIKKAFSEYKEKRTNWLYDHMWVKRGLENLLAFLLCTISAFIFAFGFNSCMDLGSFAVIDHGNIRDLTNNDVIKLGDYVVRESLFE